MKKRILVLLAFVPVLVGFLVNQLVLVPVVGSIALYILPLLTTVFWFFLGGQYARTSWKMPVSLLIGNSAGLLSLVIYLWQFLLQTDETRSMILAYVSQMFAASVPKFLFGRLIFIFEPEANHIGIATMVTMQVMAVLFMMVVFLCGYIWGKKRQRVIQFGSTM